MTGPLLTPAPTATVRFNPWFAPEAIFPMAQVAAPPTLLPGALAETNVVLPGTTSVTLTPVRPWLPLLVIAIVYVMFDPAATGSGASLLLMAILVVLGDTLVVKVAVSLIAGLKFEVSLIW